MNSAKKIFLGFVSALLVMVILWGTREMRLHRLQVQAVTLDQQILSNLRQGLDGMGQPPGSIQIPRLYGIKTIEHWTTALEQTRELVQLQRVIAQTRWRWSLRRPLGAAKAFLMGVPPARPPSGVKLLVPANDLESALEFLNWVKQQPGRLDAEGASRMSMFSINANLIAEAVGRPQPFGNALLR